FEHRLEIARRRGDDLKHLRGRGLLLPRFRQLVRAALELRLEVVSNGAFARAALAETLRAGLAALRPAAFRAVFWLLVRRAISSPGPLEVAFYRAKIPSQDGLATHLRRASAH